MSRSGTLDVARAAFARGEWSTARDSFLEADQDTRLDVDDLDRYAVAAYLIGDEEQSIGLRARVFQLSEERGDYP
ncbi:MAG TPA: LuxR family transcriptional regulator, partial [Mycobacteriales bacterium]